MSIYKCLSKFHEEVGKISKDSKNPHYKSKYADIDTVLDAIRVPLQKAGFPSPENHETRLRPFSPRSWSGHRY